MKLEKKVNIEIVPAQFVDAEEINILGISDNRENKKIIAEVQISGHKPSIQIVLWSGEKEYEQAGQWTDNDADKRILELLIK